MSSEEYRPSERFLSWVNSLNQSVNRTKYQYGSMSTSQGLGTNRFFHKTPVTDENFALGRSSELSNNSMLIVDIIVHNYIFSLGESGINRVDKKYLGTEIMAARLPSPTIEDVKEKVRKEYYPYTSSRPNLEEVKWKEQRTLQLSVNDNMKDKLMMPLSNRQRQKWMQNIKENNPGRLDNRIFGSLYGESHETAVKILRENNNIRVLNPYNNDFEYHTENSIMQLNPTTNVAEFIPAEYGSFYVHRNDFHPKSQEELLELNEDIAELNNNQIRDNVET